MCKRVLVLVFVSRFRYCVIVLSHIDTLYLHSLCVSVCECVCLCVCVGGGNILTVAILDGFLGSYNQRSQAGTGLSKFQERVL